MIMAMTYLRLHLFSLTLKPPASSGEPSDYDYDSFSSPVFGCEAPPSTLANITALVHLKSKTTSPCSTLLSYLEMYKSFDHIDPTLLQMSHDDLDRACSETNRRITRSLFLWPQLEEETTHDWLQPWGQALYQAAITLATKLGDMRH